MLSNPDMRSAPAPGAPVNAARRPSQPSAGAHQRSQPGEGRETALAGHSLAAHLFTCSTGVRGAALLYTASLGSHLLGVAVRRAAEICSVEWLRIASQSHHRSGEPLHYRPMRPPHIHPLSQARVSALILRLRIGTPFLLRARCRPSGRVRFAHLRRVEWGLASAAPPRRRLCIRPFTPITTVQLRSRDCDRPRSKPLGRSGAGHPLRDAPWRCSRGLRLHRRSSQGCAPG